MAFIEWQAQNATGISIIDTQHRQLFDLLNRLHASVTGGLEQGALESILEELINYSIYHFNTEEQLYEEHGSPDNEQNKKEHAEFTRTLFSLQQKFQVGSPTVHFDTLDFLHAWLMDHTTGIDVTFGNLLHSKGIDVHMPSTPENSSMYVPARAPTDAVTIVDEQHKQLFALLDRLKTSVSTGQEQSTLASILDGLLDYTVYHFNMEENLYKKYDSPDYEENKSQHDLFTQNLTEMRQQFNSGSATVSFDMLDFLHDWLTTHTSGIDREFCEYVEGM